MVFSFPRKNRILKTQDYRRIYENGTMLEGSFAYFYVLKDYQDSARLGITVTKKIGNAVKRVRLKRLYREIFRHRCLNLSPIQIIVNVKQSAFTQPQINLAQDWDSVLGLLEKGDSLGTTSMHDN
jgi:ribonuclease P protein component